MSGQNVSKSETRTIKKADEQGTVRRANTGPGRSKQSGTEQTKKEVLSKPRNTASIERVKGRSEEVVARKQLGLTALGEVLAHEEGEILRHNQLDPTYEQRTPTHDDRSLQVVQHRDV